MKKISVIIAVLILLLIALTGCIDNKSQDIVEAPNLEYYSSEWIEVQSITYQVIGSVTKSSYYRFTFSENMEEVSETEYNNCDNSRRISNVQSTTIQMNTDRNIDDLLKDNYFFYRQEKRYYNDDCSYDRTDYKYYRLTCTNY